MRHLIALSLRQEGCTVQEALDGRELLELLKEAHATGSIPAFVISDYRMPGVTGLEVLSWVSRSLPDVPFILLSAFADPKLRREGAALGAFAVLNKSRALPWLRELLRTSL